MSKELNELLNDLKDWINCPLDEIERYGVWELEVNQSKELLDYINQLQQENKILKENAENNDKVVDKVNWDNKVLKKENQQLKEQLDISETNYEIIYGYFTQIGELLDEETCEGMLDKIIKLKNQLKQRDEVIDEAIKKLNNFVDCCKAEKLESGSDYLHHQYWNMFERFNKQVKKILKKYKGENNG